MLNLATCLIIVSLAGLVLPWPLAEGPKGDMTLELWDYVMEEAHFHPWPTAPTVTPSIHTPDENIGLEDGEDLVEGDIILTEPDDMWRLVNANPNPWPDSTVYFKGNLTKVQWQRVADAISWIKKLTCIRFNPAPDDKTDFVFFTSIESEGCCSEIGYIGRVQYLNLDSNCWGNGDITHQLMHTLGFPHEQTRKDRDHRVVIHWENIAAPDRRHFKMQNGRTFGLTYDTYSLMHYGELMLSNNERKTITTMNGETIGHRERISWGDIYKMNRFYQCDCRHYECGPLPYVNEDAHFQIQAGGTQVCVCQSEDGVHVKMDNCEIKADCSWRIIRSTRWNWTFQLLNVKSGKAVRASGGDKIDVIPATEGDDDSILWWLNHLFFFDEMKNAGIVRCLDVKGGSAIPGASVIHSECTDGKIKNWKAIKVAKQNHVQYHLRTKRSQLCLCLTVDGKNVETDNCGERTSCSWFIVPVGLEALKLVSVQTSQMLQVVGNSELQMTSAPAREHSAHWWFNDRDNYDDIANVENGRCIDVNGTAKDTPGTPVIHWECVDGNINQKWIAIELAAKLKYQILLKGGKLCMCVAADGQSVQIEDCEETRSCSWFVLPVGKGTFQFESVQTGELLQVVGDFKMQMTSAPAREHSAHWRFTNRDNYEIIANEDNARCIDVDYNPGGRHGAPVIHWECAEGNINQKWKAVELDRKVKYHLQLKGGHLCMCVGADGKHAVTDHCKATRSCSWFILPVGQEAFKFASVQTGELLQAVDNFRIQLTSAPAPENSVHWRFTDRNNYENVANMGNARCIDVDYNAGGTPGAPVIHWECSDGNINQKWKVIEIGN